MLAIRPAASARACCELLLKSVVDGDPVLRQGPELLLGKAHVHGMGAIGLDDRLIRKPDIEEVAVAGQFLDGHAEAYVCDAGYGAQHALTALGHRKHLLVRRLGVEDNHVPDHAYPFAPRIAL